MAKGSPYERKRQQEQKKLQLWLDTDTSRDFEEALKGLGYYNISETKTNRQKWFKEIVDRTIGRAEAVKHTMGKAQPIPDERGTQEVLYPLWINAETLKELDAAIKILGYRTRSQWFRDQGKAAIYNYREARHGTH
jgi:hypothetical protein